MCIQIKQLYISLRIRTGIPTYVDLIKCVQEKQRLSNREIVQNMKAEAVGITNSEEVNDITQEPVQQMEVKTNTINKRGDVCNKCLSKT